MVDLADATDMGIPDFAEQHDHYLYGTGKALAMATFIDTSYVIALANTADRYHERASALALQSLYFDQTEAVLTEIGNALARLRWRQYAVSILQRFQEDPEHPAVPVSAALFGRALRLYGERMDKSGLDGLHLFPGDAGSCDDGGADDGSTLSAGGLPSLASGRWSCVKGSCSGEQRVSDMRQATVLPTERTSSLLGGHCHATYTTGDHHAC